MAKDSDPDNSVIIDGFGLPFRTDRCPGVTGKKEVVFAYILTTTGAVLLL